MSYVWLRCNYETTIEFQQGNQLNIFSFDFLIIIITFKHIYFKRFGAF